MSKTQAITQGEVIHIPGTGPDHDRNRGHFFVVVEAPDDEGRIILVPYCTYHEKCDKTCVLEPGSYEKVKDKSFIMYSQTKYYLHTHVVGQIALGIMKKYSSIDPYLFKKIRDGALLSSLTPRIYKKRLTYLDEIASAASTPSIDETQGS